MLHAKTLVLSLLEKAGFHCLHPVDEAPFADYVEDVRTKISGASIVTEVCSLVHALMSVAEAHHIEFSSETQRVLRLIADSSWHRWHLDVTEEEWQEGRQGLCRARERFVRANEQSSQKCLSFTTGW